jgi:sugar phosphate isomerase/epimerase
MNFSIVLSTQPSSFSALAYKGNLAGNIAKIKALGFDGVELAVRDPGLLDADFLLATLKEAKLTVPAIGTGQAFVEEQLSFTDSRREVREQAIQRIRSQVKLAERLNAIVIIGLVRGKSDTEVSHGSAERWLIEAMQECASVNESISFAIEPINRYETNLVNSVRSGMELLAKINKKNVGLLLDTFHMNIEESSLLSAIKSARKHLFHFHVADSNRWYPGAGHVDFRAVFDTLKEIDYSGFVSAEILPLPDPDTAAKQTIKFFKSL